MIWDLEAVHAEKFKSNRQEVWKILRNEDGIHELVAVNNEGIECCQIKEDASGRFQVMKDDAGGSKYLIEMQRIANYAKEIMPKGGSLIGGIICLAGSGEKVLPIYQVKERVGTKLFIGKKQVMPNENPLKSLNIAAIEFAAAKRWRLDLIYKQFDECRPVFIDEKDLPLTKIAKEKLLIDLGF